MRLTVFLVLALAQAMMSASAQPDSEAGRRSYEVCAGCHGFEGEGNRLVGAPRLAGIETWYLERQIRNFAAGSRGHLAADTNGRRMALMAQAVESDRELGDLLAWIDSLPGDTVSVDALSGDALAAGAADGPDAARGQSLYALCSACHGMDGRGNEALGAPGLVALEGWYIAEQLRLYAEGLRGTHPADTYGAQMRALIMNFDTEEERQALVSFIATLSP